MALSVLRLQAQTDTGVLLSFVAEEEWPIPHRLAKQRRVNWLGMFAFLAFLGAFFFYIYARIAYTLGLGGLLW